jgi:hypothetical protein
VYVIELDPSVKYPGFDGMWVHVGGVVEAA